MIDFTTIQTHPIPLPILELQEVNANLSRENSSLKKIITGRNIFIGVLLVSSVLALGVIFNKSKLNNNNKTK